MKPTKGIAVDGYCKGNPGPGGYRGVCLETGKILFKADIGVCTNNIAEYIGLCHALGYCKKVDRNYSLVYSDSTVAIAWVKNKGCDSKFFTGDKPELAKQIWKCDMFLIETKSLPGFLKWKTNEWGEIPADFGHKVKL